MTTIADIYAAECDACRLEALAEEAHNTARRLRLEYDAAVRRVRELVRAAAECHEQEPADEPEQAEPATARTLFDDTTEDAP